MKKILIFVFALLFLTGCEISSNSKYDYEEKIESLEHEIEDLTFERDNLKETLGNCRNQRDEYQEYYENNCNIDDNFNYEFNDY